MTSSKSPLTRALRQVKKREVQKMNTHLEKLGAAFVKETGLNPKDTALVQKENEDGTKEYAFTARTWNPADLSPELRDLFNICFELARAESAADKEKGVELLKEFMKGLAADEKTA
jgi:hypothetical protein